jgi:hypothetical protein
MSTWNGMVDSVAVQNVERTVENRKWGEASRVQRSAFGL